MATAYNKVAYNGSELRSTPPPMAKTDEYRVAAELAEAVRAWTAVRRRRLGSEAVEPPPPASFLSS